MSSSMSRGRSGVKRKLELESPRIEGIKRFSPDNQNKVQGRVELLDKEREERKDQFLMDMVVRLQVLHFEILRLIHENEEEQEELRQYRLNRREGNFW